MSKVLYTKIKQIEFGLWPAGEVKEYAVAEINRSNLAGPNSMCNTVYDYRMGTTENRTSCATCLLPLKECTGHCGYIDLVTPIAHPLFVPQIIQYLKVVCSQCCLLRFSEQQLPLMGLHYDKINSPAKQVSYFDKLLQSVSKVERCPHCETALPDYYQNEGVVYKFFNGKKEKNIQVSDVEIDQIFSKIPQSEVRKMGYADPEQHPMKLIISVLPVLPNCARPQCETANGHKKDDDLSQKYIDIIKQNNKLKQDNLPENERQAHLSRLKFHCKTLMDNSKGLAVQMNGRPIKALKARLNGKDGLIRCHLSGKRVNFSARTVIGPDPTLDTDEIAVPHHIATTQTFPEKCHKNNMTFLQTLVDKQQANYIIRDGKPKNLNYLTQSHFKLLPTDRVVKMDQGKFDGNISCSPSRGHLLDKFVAECRATCEGNFSALFDKLKRLDMRHLGLPSFTIKQYESQKRLAYVLCEEDWIIRDNVFYFDLENFGFVFEKGDTVIRRQSTSKVSSRVDAAGKFQGQPAYMSGGRQQILDVGNIVDRQGYQFGHLKPFVKKPVHVQLGDVVERHLLPGDLIAFGRHPTLHKGSLMARKVKIVDEAEGLAINNGLKVKTIRMNLAQTKAYNADFDV